MSSHWSRLANPKTWAKRGEGCHYCSSHARCVRIGHATAYAHRLTTLMFVFFRSCSTHPPGAKPFLSCTAHSCSHTISIRSHPSAQLQSPCQCFSSYQRPRSLASWLSILLGPCQHGQDSWRLLVKWRFDCTCRCRTERLQGWPHCNTRIPLRIRRFLAISSTVTQC